MNAYIYQAEIYCPRCANQIKAALKVAGKVPPLPKGEFVDAADKREVYEHTYDSDVYPKGPFEDGGGEADTPQHCATCHKPLGNPLTVAGVKYVVESLKEYVSESLSGSGSVLDGWAESLNSYTLDDDQQFVLTAFRRVRELEESDDDRRHADIEAGERE